MDPGSSGKGRHRQTLNDQKVAERLALKEVGTHTAKGLNDHGSENRSGSGAAGAPPHAGNTEPKAREKPWLPPSIHGSLNLSSTVAPFWNQMQEPAWHEPFKG